MGLLDGAKGFIDKLGFFGGDEDPNLEEEEDEEYEQEEELDEEGESGSFFSRLRGRFAGRASRGEDPEEAPRLRREAPAADLEPRPAVRDNVIRDERMITRAAQTAQTPHAVHREHLIDVRQIEECREIIKYLLQGETVLLNLENMDPKDCGRIVDLLSGAAFALQGRMIKVAHLCYLLAPQSVEVIDDKNRPAAGRGGYSQRNA